MSFDLQNLLRSRYRLIQLVLVFIVATTILTLTLAYVTDTPLSLLPSTSLPFSWQSQDEVNIPASHEDDDLSSSRPNGQVDEDGILNEEIIEMRRPILVIQHFAPLSAGTGAELQNASRETHRRYCQAWGYGYMDDHESYVPDEDGAKNVNKLYSLLRFMVEEEGKGDNGAEWIMQTDADTLIYNPSIPLHHLLPPSHLTPTPWILGNQDSNGFNDGVVLYRVCRDIIDMLIAALSWEAEERSKGESPSDQYSLAHVIEWGGGLDKRDTIIIPEVESFLLEWMKSGKHVKDLLWNTGVDKENIVSGENKVEVEDGLNVKNLKRFREIKQGKLFGRKGHNSLHQDLTQLKEIKGRTTHTKADNFDIRQNMGEIARSVIKEKREDQQRGSKWSKHFYIIPMKWLNDYYTDSEEGSQSDGWTPQLHVHLVADLKYRVDWGYIIESAEEIYRRADEVARAYKAGSNDISDESQGKVSRMERMIRSNRNRDEVQKKDNEKKEKGKEEEDMKLVWIEVEEDDKHYQIDLSEEKGEGIGLLLLDNGETADAAKRWWEGEGGQAGIDRMIFNTI
ncbi:hypothetical protein M231_02161 [Tremella mesenterica]|uniref:Glycosyltransferase family 34 protein n=1 Tax=Tremella mesenterica TaxID=5217 RepID=A0A4Q1BRF2_TREME|nr:hypothetical protein M231_02161 [Tremella mesenterica]